MLRGRLCSEVRRDVEDWIPERRHERDAAYRADLHEHLERRLNGTGGMGLGLAGGHDLPIRDLDPDDALAIGEVVAILVTGDLDEDAFADRVERYREEYQCVIGVACGVDDVATWAALRDRLSEGAGEAVDLLYKHENTFGKERWEVDRDRVGLGRDWR